MIFEIKWIHLTKGFSSFHQNSAKCIKTFHRFDRDGAYLEPHLARTK